MKLEDIPRREEILILTEAHQRLDRVLVSQHFDRRVASFAEIAHVARAVWIGTLRGTPMTAEQIARTIGMPCSTVMSKLGYLIRHGHICQDGTPRRRQGACDAHSRAGSSHRCVYRGGGRTARCSGKQPRSRRDRSVAFRHGSACWRGQANVPL